MSALVVGVSAATAVAGVLIMVAAWTGVLSRPEGKSPWWRRWRTEHLSARMVCAAVGALVGWLVTGWPVMAAALAWAGWVTPGLIGIGRARRRQLARSEAIATWAESLRDLLSAAAGLREAIARSADVAPPAIRKEVVALEKRTQRGELTTALRRFAVDVDDQIADTIVIALELTESRATSDIADLLGAAARSARESVAMQQRINATRSRTFRTAQLVSGVLVAFVAGVIVINREYLEPFDDAAGQVALAVVVALFAAAIAALVRLSRPPLPPRLLQVGARS